MFPKEAKQGQQEEEEEDEDEVAEWFSGPEPGEHAKHFTYLYSRRCCRIVCDAPEVKLSQDHGI